MRARLPKEYRPIAKKAMEQGWTIERTRGSNHWKWTPPTGKGTGCVYSPSTPSDPRSLPNVIRQLRERGFKR